MCDIYGLAAVDLVAVVRAKQTRLVEARRELDALESDLFVVRGELKHALRYKRKAKLTAPPSVPPQEEQG